MIVAAGSPAPAARNGGRVTRGAISDAGGLRQFGLALETLAPGAYSSDRHWHEAEDEFLYMLAGVAAMIDEHGASPVLPGQAVCWPAGIANGHHMQNRSNQPCSYLILGSRIRPEVVHYADSGHTQTDDTTSWRVTDAAATILRQGSLPDHLRNLLPRPRPALQASHPVPVLTPETVAAERGTPEQVIAMGAFEALLFSDSGGLTQFGAFVETLAPGSRSSERHWHAQEDECAYVLSGEATVIEDDGPHLLRPGDAACWPAGVANGHHILNRSALPCSYLVVGTRLPSDRVQYSEVDRLYVRIDGIAARTRRDGTPL